MPARNTFFIPGSYYHIYNRGSEKRIIFGSPRDYNFFFTRVQENADKFSIDILCHSFMPNHFHFLVKQRDKHSVSVFMNALQLGYAKYFNVKYHRVGPLYQGRFKAKPVETDEYLLQLSAYIHRQPIANAFGSENFKDSKNLVRQQLATFPYSSYRHYIGLENNGLTKPAEILAYFSKSKPMLTYNVFVEKFEPDIEMLAPLLAAIE
ncbi:hypothetical protein A2Z00_02760 [Candidatus Gottesmanbacteria bacterium RBG_13_45_10]|uniref:Transposase IS200-like domain-containing protein n=1 Tax=Candidatus Gottesmanbacteria bacterium RBG_13_45_10 TaxID=1798370 RepID=A0A1F5ZGA4_9BACT|nr:MAG: hypothetical protein A2Z00_02760 [Candidatus Gottesmanbacteria bacterium RBG_13_45_10]